MNSLFHFTFRIEGAKDDTYEAGPLKWQSQAEMIPYANIAVDRCRTVTLPRMRVAVSCEEIGDLVEDDLSTLFYFVSKTPNLDWIIQTKDPEKLCEKIGSLREKAAAYPNSFTHIDGARKAKNLRRRLPNLWVLSKVSRQSEVDSTIDSLLCVEFAKRVAYLELVEPVSLVRSSSDVNFHLNMLSGELIDYGGPDDYRMPYIFDRLTNGGVDWVIVCGQRGRNAMPMKIDWVRILIRECAEYRVPLFVDCLGSNVWSSIEEPPQMGGRQYGGFGWRYDLRDPNGSDTSEWSDDIRVREVPK